MSDTDVYGLFFDPFRHCCIRVLVEDEETFFVQNGFHDPRLATAKGRRSKNRSNVDLYSMPTTDFNRLYTEGSTGKPLQEIAQRMLDLKNIGTTITDRAKAHLMAITQATTHQENTMSERTVTAPRTSKTTAVPVDPKSGVPSQKGTVAENAKVMAGPKGTTQEMIDAAKTKAAKADPKATKADPKATKATKATKADPKATKADPKATKADPKATKAAPAKAKAEATDRSARYAGMKIKNLKSDYTPREGSWTAFMVECMTSCSTTDEAMAKCAKSKEFGDRRLDFGWAVDKGIIELK